ncbi:MAG TPA: serine/threonine-protein kinase [Gemmataceae bacterium]|jgi:serine/threonine-protein kinase|nr:serine/threonine-protein kinase [Gemmataceae bacterium]
MTTVELGACEWFVWDLRRSNLIDRGQLDQVVSDYLRKNPRAEPPDLAQFLVAQEILTPFQAERLLQSKTQGLVLGPYTLMDALGSGSMGTVYKALSKNDHQWYAVKVLPRRSMWNVRIARRQVRAFEQCKHPAVVPFVDVGTSGSTHYLAWPLVDGESLENIIQKNGKLTPELAALYALQAAEGLEVCHQHNLIHGLVKPSNLMLGADQQVYILDFGIGSLLANSEGESLVDTMSTANTLTSGLDCASPECIMEPSNRTPAGDQYSLGCVLYYCLTGKYPFPDGTAVDKMMAHQTKQPQAIREISPEVPEALVAVVDRLMQKKPEERYGNSAEVIEALRPLAPTPSALGIRPALRASRQESGAYRGGGGVNRLHTDRRNPGTDAPASRLPNIKTDLPTRQSLRGDTPVAGGPPNTPVIPESSRRVPQSFSVGEPPKLPIEDRIGPMGITIGVMLAAGVTWVLSMWLFQ